jgi:hypothetical protein
VKAADRVWRLGKGASVKKMETLRRTMLMRLKLYSDPVFFPPDYPARAALWIAVDDKIKSVWDGIKSF